MTAEPTDGSTAFVSASVEDPDAPVIAIGGELDLASVDAARAGIEEYLVNEPRVVIFDLEKLAFMDSSGIALLVQTANRVGTVVVKNASPIVRRVLEATGLLEAFGISQ